MFNLYFQFGQSFVEFLYLAFLFGQLSFEQFILTACFVAFSLYLSKFQSDTHDLLLILNQQRGGRLRRHICLIRWYHASLTCLERHMHILVTKAHAVIFRHQRKHLHVIAGKYALASRRWACCDRQVFRKLITPVLDRLMAHFESVFHIFRGKKFIHADSLQPTATLRNIDAKPFEVRLEVVVNQAKHLRLVANWRIIRASLTTKNDDQISPKSAILEKSTPLYIKGHINKVVFQSLLTSLMI